MIMHCRDPSSAGHDIIPETKTGRENVCLLDTHQQKDSQLVPRAFFGGARFEVFYIAYPLL